MPAAVAPEIRQAAIARVRAGATVSAAAAELHVDAASVSRWCKAAKVATAPPPARLVEGQAAARAFGRDQRCALLDAMFERAEMLIAACDDPRKLQTLAAAVATLVDKRRLEDGEATARTEVSSVGARERIAGRLDELAARRAAQPPAV